MASKYESADMRPELTVKKDQIGIACLDDIRRFGDGVSHKHLPTNLVGQFVNFRFPACYDGSA